MDRETPVASIGSCFARQIKYHLVSNGFNYVQTAKGKNARHSSAAWDRVYNTFCLRQEFERALGEFNPLERFWELPDRIVDPYRKQVEWKNRERAELELEHHRLSAREAFILAEVLIITVGLTEIWYNKVDNSVFFEKPPEPVFNPEIHAFRNSTVEENFDNLESIHRLFKAVNPNGKFLVTVSPVPLNATYQEQNVLISNALSKATLVVATSRFVSNHEDVYYFPSYEFVTAGIGDMYTTDNRHVTPEAAQTIMKVFERMYVF